MADMDIFIYPNTTADEPAASLVEDSLDQACSEVIGNTSIEDYNTLIRMDNPGDSSSQVDRSPDSRSEFYNEFSQWREDNYSDIGCHIGVSADISGGRADGGNSSNSEDDAFVDQKDAVSEGGEDDSGNVAIQETFHTFLDKDLDDNVDNEHELGTITESGSVTPMATGYEYRYADEGECSSNRSWAGTYTTSPTSCTNNLLEDTYRDGNSGGGCNLTTATVGEGPIKRSIKHFRYETMSKTIFGELLMKFYYRFSGNFAKSIRRNPNSRLSKLAKTLVEKCGDHATSRKRSSSAGKQLYFSTIIVSLYSIAFLLSFVLHIKTALFRRLNPTGRGVER